MGKSFYNILKMKFSVLIALVALTQGLRINQRTSAEPAAPAKADAPAADAAPAKADAPAADAAPAKADAQAADAAKADAPAADAAAKPEAPPKGADTEGAAQAREASSKYANVAA